MTLDLLITAIVVTYLLSLVLPRKRPIATSIRLTLEGVKDMNIVPGTYNLRAQGHPIGSVLTEIAFASSDPNVVTVTQQGADPALAVVVALVGAARIDVSVKNSAGATLSKSLDLAVAEPVPVADDILLSLEPA